MKPKSNVIEFEGIGTHWWIEIFEDMHGDLKSSVQEIVQEFENNYSRFLPTSYISILNEKKVLKNPKKELLELIELGNDAKKITNGSFNIAVGKILENMGYDAKYSFKSKKLKKFDDFINLNDKEIKIGKDTRIDLGGIGKGFLIDKVKDYLLSINIKYFSINAGGDIYATSSIEKSIKFYLENPFDMSEAIGEIKVLNGAIASSSGNRRRWKDQRTKKVLNHLVNMKTKKNIEDIAAVYTYGTSALHTDIASTAIFISQRDMYEKIANYYNIEYLIVFQDKTFINSKNYPGRLYN